MRIKSAKGQNTCDVGEEIYLGKAENIWSEGVFIRETEGTLGKSLLV